jgi:hypothetical protein
MYKVILGLALGYAGGLYFVEDFFVSGIGSTAFSYECKKPFDIPDTLTTGEKIDWDCEWQAAYNDGDVKVIYTDKDSTKGAEMLVMFSSY